MSTPFGEMSGSQVVVLVDGRIGFREVSYTIGPRENPHVTITGRVDDVLRFEKLALAADFTANVATTIGPFVMAELEALGWMEGRIKLSDEDGSLGLERFEAATLEESEVQLRVSGVVDDLNQITGADLTIDLQVPRLWMIQRLLRSDIEPDKSNLFFQAPASISGHFLAEDLARFASFEGAGNLGEDEIFMDLTMRDLATRPDIKGALAVSKLKLREFGMILARGDTEIQNQESKSVFPEIEFFVPA